MLLSFCGQNPVNLAPIGSCIYTHIHSSVFNVFNFMSSFLSLNDDRSFTAERRSLWRSKVMKLRHVLLKKHFYRFHVIFLALKVPSSRSCLPSGLNHKSDLKNGVDIKHFLMFIHNHFMLVNLKMIGLNWGDTVICQDTLKMWIHHIYCLNFF